MTLAAILYSHGWRRAVIDLGRLTALLVFIVLGLRVVWYRKRHLAERRPAAVFVTYCVVVSSVAGFAQIEAWPFTTWALVHHLSVTEINVWRLYGVDGNGRAYPIDTRFVEPLPYEDFDTWLRLHFLQLDRPNLTTLRGLDPRDVTARQRPVAAFLLGRAESARVRFRQTGRAGTNTGILGPLAAPYHFVRPAQWKSLADVPDTPFVRFQIWQEQWRIEDRLRDESKVERRLIFDYAS
jgi:hypothetical protein